MYYSNYLTMDVTCDTLHQGRDITTDYNLRRITSGVGHYYTLQLATHYTKGGTCLQTTTCDTLGQGRYIATD